VLGTAGLIVFAISLVILQVKRVELANYLPSLVYAPLLAWLKGRLQAAILALFFLPYILPVSVVYLIWDWTLNFQFGIAMHVLDLLGIDRVPVTKSKTWFMPAVAWITIWWTCGFSILLFLAGLRAIPVEIYEAAALDNSARWTTFRRITWPLLWPVTTLVFTIQLITNGDSGTGSPSRLTMETRPSALCERKMASAFFSASRLMTRLLVCKPSTWQISRITARVMPGNAPRPVGVVQILSW
jgi:ABC-type molybdate transport system permease subunit